MGGGGAEPGNSATVGCSEAAAVLPLIPLVDVVDRLWPRVLRCAPYSSGRRFDLSSPSCPSHANSEPAELVVLVEFVAFESIEKRGSSGNRLFGSWNALIACTLPPVRS